MSRCRAFPFRVHPSGSAAACAGELSLIKPDFSLRVTKQGGSIQLLKNPRPKDSTLGNLRA